MIVMILAVQIAASALPQGAPIETIPPPRGHIAPAYGLIRTLPSKNCPFAGKMEAAFGKPVALYRSGDRPPKTYLRWADYPDGRFCAAAAGR